MQLTFRASRPSGWYLLVPLVASIGLIIAGPRWQEISKVEQFLARIVWPIQRAVDTPFNLVEQSQSFLRERLNLLNENTHLQRQQIYLQAQVQRLSALEAENLELRELLQSVGRDIETFSEARLINADSDPFTQQILLNKGKQQGVEVGQPVIDAHGLVGVVLGMNEHTSRVLLLTDPGFAVPVQSVRSGERAIAIGSGAGGELRLSYVPRTADFVEGDQLVTSGIGGRFPVGYPVGTITSIQHDPSTRFTLIGVSPSAKLGQFRHVLLVKHHNRIALEEASKPTLSHIEQPPAPRAPEMPPPAQASVKKAEATPAALEQVSIKKTEEIKKAEETSVPVQNSIKKAEAVSAPVQKKLPTTQTAKPQSIEEQQAYREESDPELAELEDFQGHSEEFDEMAANNEPLGDD